MRRFYLCAQRLLTVFQTPLFSATASHRSFWQGLGGLLLILLLSCLVGIFSRPLGYFASFWIANAVVLGLLLRAPHLAMRPVTWLCMWLVYMAADAMTGASLFVLVAFNSANIVGVFFGWSFLYRVGVCRQGFQRQRGVLILFAGSLLAAFCGALVGMWPSHIAFDKPMWSALVMWTATEFCHYVLILPVILAAPRGWIWQWFQRTQPWLWQRSIVPLLALLLSEVLSQVFPGPGAIAFVVPALVWCAMAYGVFPTAVLNLLVSIWEFSLMAMGTVTFAPEFVIEVTSLRTGMSLLSLAPLAVACAYGLHKQTLHQLSHIVNHDFLTGALARRALMECGRSLLQRLEHERRSVAVVMLDLDHFKRINDRYGHAQGDEVLKKFVELAHTILRPGDLLGRMGGEEFALILAGMDANQARGVAQRLGDLVRAHPFVLDDGTVLHATVSMGVCTLAAPQGPMPDLEVLLAQADAALYQAKQLGRDRTCCVQASVQPVRSTAAALAM